MEFQTTGQFAQKWNFSPRTVRNFCENGKIPEAYFSGKQWMIPIDAKPPIDGRTKSGKASPSFSRYRFPIFIFSSSYNNPPELNEAERLLLSAQKIYLEGKYSQSIGLCYKILTRHLPAYLLAGTYCTLGFDALFLGSIYEYQHSVKMLRQLYASADIHAEDFKLIMVSLTTRVNRKLAAIYDIHPDELSCDAVFYYKYLLLIAFLMSAHSDSRIILQYILAESRLLEKKEMTPAYFSFQCLLGACENIGISNEEKERHMKTAIQIAVDNNWTGHLVMYYCLASSLMENCLKKYGDEYVKKLKLDYKRARKHLEVIEALETNDSRFALYSPQQLELLLLLSYEYTCEHISFIKNIKEGEIKNQIRKLCEIADIDSQEELIRYAKTFFDSSSPESK